MNAPLIFITYGFTKKICSWEENGIQKVPVFDNALLASIFVESFRETVIDKEPPQPQICTNKQYAMDIIKMINIITSQLQQNVTIIRNPLPINRDPDETISKIAKDLGSFTVINKEYDIEEALEALQSE